MGWDTLVVVTHPLNRRAGSSERGQDRCGWFCRGRGWMDERDKVHGVPDEETMRLPVLPPPGGGGDRRFTAARHPGVLPPRLRRRRQPTNLVVLVSDGVRGMSGCSTAACCCSLCVGRSAFVIVSAEVGSTQGILAERSPVWAWVPERMAEWVDTLVKRSKKPGERQPPYIPAFISTRSERGRSLREDRPRHRGHARSLPPSLARRTSCQYVIHRSHPHLLLLR